MSKCGSSCQNMENFWQGSKLVYSEITKALVLASVICKKKKKILLLQGTWQKREILANDVC